MRHLITPISGNLIKYSLKLNTINKRSIFSSVENTELEHFFIQSTYVIIITSIIWGFESYSNLQKKNSMFNNFLNEAYFKCIEEGNSKNNCINYKQYLTNIFNSRHMSDVKETFLLKFSF